MIKALLTLFLVLPLLSIAPIPPAPAAAAPLAWAQFAIVIHAPAAKQACTWETAPARLQQQISDPAGVPFGSVAAWSCSGDSAAVIAELQTRAAAMQSEAAIYRASHPIGGTR